MSIKTSVLVCYSLREALRLSSDTWASQVRLPSSAESWRGRAPGRPATRGGAWEEREDVNGHVISTLNRCMPGLDLAAGDIVRPHRVPGPNSRVIVRFVRSGQSSVRDQIWTRRLELRGRELFISESLT